MSVPSKPRPPKRRKKPAASIVEEPAVELEEAELEDDDDGFVFEVALTAVGTVLKAPHGEFITTHTCPNKWECGAKMETRGVGYPTLTCPHCNVRMVAVSKKVE